MKGKDNGELRLVLDVNRDQMETTPRSAQVFCARLRFHVRDRSGLRKGREGSASEESENKTQGII